MQGSRMADADAEPDQPHGQMRVSVTGRVPPRVAVVHAHSPRQSESTKRVDQMSFYRVSSLVRARLQDLRVARVIVEHRQGITLALSRCEVTLEVDLRE